MAKTKSLTDLVRAERPSKTVGPTSWHYMLRQQSPQKMQEIDDLIDAWNGGDAALIRVLPAKQTLAKRIAQELTSPPKPESIVRYITERASRGTQR